VPLPVLDHASPPLHPARLPPARVEALYVHIPFCFHKCHYCDFYSITRQTPQRMTHFVDLLLKEANRWRQVEQLIIQPRTIFFGGGTPTLLPPDQMARLLGGLSDRFDRSNLEEWTIEANPATVNLPYCQMLRRAGVNRISFGAQSFDEAELKVLERHHDPRDVAKSLDFARSAGFERLNLDLIYAIPGQSLASWERSLEQAIELGTSHLSCYGLTYEPNTPITVRKRLGQITAAEESVELDMLRHTRQRLSAIGMPAYEVSNYASAGEECRHNLVYWTGGNYISLGPSAASHVNGWRWRNRPHLGEWERAIESAMLPAIEVETLSEHRRAGELAMLMLRLARGINFADFSARTGMDARALWSDQIERYVHAGLLRQDRLGFALTERGLVVADALAAEFLDPEPAFPIKPA
jgi:oxygen-independent coproporphyrinogen-3 oxidase